jgi:predicted amino acid-binding ACT domain protein
MPAYRLRIELHDRPGALAAVSAQIAAAEANITSIDVHEVDGSTAVDEIVVEVAEEWAPRALAEALAESGAGVLLSSRRMISNDDAVASALRSAAAMIGGTPENVNAECRAALLALAHGTSARLVGLETAEPAAVMALERRTSIVTRDGEHGWILAALDDTVEPAVVALVTRPLNVRFSATEVSRVEALLRLCRLVGAAVVPSGS